MLITLIITLTHHQGTSITLLKLFHSKFATKSHANILQFKLSLYNFRLCLNPHVTNSAGVHIQIIIMF